MSIPKSGLYLLTLMAGVGGLLLMNERLASDTHIAGLVVIVMVVTAGITVEGFSR